LDHHLFADVGLHDLQLHQRSPAALKEIRPVLVLIDERRKTHPPKERGLGFPMETKPRDS
jgi:hypothetical protein